jgi:polyisoprenoid-binding protein YceI
MFFKLLREIPQMFIIAAIIWLFVLAVFIKNNRKKNLGFFYKHRSTFTSIFVGLVLTIADIWLFVSFIPTHFKKVVPEGNVLPNFELLDSTVSNPKNVALSDTLKKSGTKDVKTNIPTQAEKVLLTKNASIRFYSHGAAEDIEATNSNVASSFNETTGQLKLTGLIRGFVFENGMMQEHFNDPDYMNSAAFPKTSFNGSIQNIKSIDFTKDGNHKIQADGTISIHGVSKEIHVSGDLNIRAGKPSLKSIFKIKRADFGINTDEIADELEITVICDFK